MCGVMRSAIGRFRRHSPVDETLQLERKAEQARRLRLSVTKRRSLGESEHILKHYEAMANQLESEVSQISGRLQHQS